MLGWAVERELGSRGGRLKASSAARVGSVGGLSVEARDLFHPRVLRG